VIEIKKSIYQEVIKTITNVQASRTVTGTGYPYANITYPNQGEFDESGRTDIVLEIDIWDNLNDATRLETITKGIDCTLNRFIDRTNRFRVYRLNPYRFELDERDENIYRRQLRYQIIKI
jgi:hypothetical protein